MNDMKVVPCVYCQNQPAHHVVKVDKDIPATHILFCECQEGIDVKAWGDNWLEAANTWANLMIYHLGQKDLQERFENGFKAAAEGYVEYEGDGMREDKSCWPWPDKKVWADWLADPAVQAGAKRLADAIDQDIVDDLVNRIQEEKMGMATGTNPIGTEDAWKHRSKKMLCPTCMYFVEKKRSDDGPRMDDTYVGRCRRHAPTMSGFPVMFNTDWCGDHKLNEEKI